LTAGRSVVFLSSTISSLAFPHPCSVCATLYGQKYVDTPYNYALSKMQAFYGLPETGKVDTSVLDLVRAPRCGFPDVKAFSTFVNEPRWDRYDLTYSSIYINYEMVEAAIAKAFKVWADATAFKFTKVEDDEADIIIYFVKGAHGDNSPFFPNSNTMAHAYPPGEDIGGDIHFNDGFIWANGNIPVVAAHEIGHSLGLGHSHKMAALMYPTYTFDKKEPVLMQDDLDGIKSLYGETDVQGHFVVVHCACCLFVFFSAFIWC
uniref:Peptidase metallopeptidase domain-containing protein n=1 Tax=Eptatretus burgeri TaxID=7764 RepID=A0A8C4R3I3_EPTBU